MKESFYVYNNGSIRRKDNSLQFVTGENEKRDIPIERVNDIYVMSEMTFNTSLINILSQYGVTVHFFNYYNFYNGSFYPRENLLSGNLLVQQSAHYLNYEYRLAIAKKLVQGAAANIYRNLRYYNSRGKDVQVYMNDIDNYRKQIPHSKSIPELMGYEGNIRQTY